jgi:predicted O-methyltransferase YrrM
MNHFRHLLPKKGFLDETEGMALYELALQQSALGPCLELGSYCGLSTVYLGQACKERNNTLYAVDHHLGSEEHQYGEEYHDSELYDATRQRMNSFPYFQDTLFRAELESNVVPVVASSEVALKHWATPLSLVFVDGGHSEEMAKRDCLGWSKHLVSGGVLAVHDIFEHPEDGGQGPYRALQAVLQQQGFELIDQVMSLGLARKR